MTVQLSSPAPVLSIGPDPSAIGGMSSVVSQIQRLGFSGRYRLTHLSATVSPLPHEGRISRIVRHLSQLTKTVRTLVETDAALVHLHTCSGFSFFRSAVDVLLARALGRRVILHNHGAAFDEFWQRSGWVKRRVIARTLTAAHRVIALSSTWARRLRDMAPKARVVVVENAVDIPACTPVRRHDGPCRFLLLARMDLWKGVVDLLDAAAILHREGLAFELVLAGPQGSAGDERDLQAQIAARNLEGIVRYVGPVGGSDKTDLLLWADVYVQPSHHEGMPLAVLEALSYGLPVIASEVGGIPDILHDHREGQLVPPKRPDRLAAAMNDLACDPLRRECMSIAARRLARTRFSLARFEEDLAAVYDAVLRTADHAKQATLRPVVAAPPTIATT